MNYAITDTAHDEQLAREQAAQVNGIERYRESVRRAGASHMAASTAPAVKLQKQLIEPAAEAVQRWIDETFKSNRAASKARVVSALGAHHAAYLTLQHIINGLGTESVKIAKGLGSDIADNATLALALKKEETGPLLKYLLNEKYKGAGKHYKAYGLDRARRSRLGLAKRSERLKAMSQQELDEQEVIETFEVSAEDAQAIGTALIKAVIGATSGFEYKKEENEAFEGLFVEVLDWTYSRKARVKVSTNMLYPTKHYLRFMDAGHSVVEAIRPIHEVMLSKPLPWTGPYEGGFLSSRIPAVKNVSPVFLQDAHESGKLAPLYAVLNALQDTPWKYNEKLLSVAKTLWEEGAKLTCWPERGDRETPAKPSGAQGNEKVFKVTHPEEWKKWKGQAAEVHKFNHSTKRLTAIQEITTRMHYATSHVNKGNPTFYEVWQADSRGRVYPVASFISSQGDNFCKALYLFANGKKMTETGAKWLKIHIANCWANNKLDKAKYDKRIKWVEDNTEAIVAAGTDPLNNLWWTEADGGKKPWLFLAACIEYAEFLKNGMDHVTYLPVSIDGACNGIQHYSAAMRSRKEGQLVNLVTVEEVQDIYNAVAIKTNELLAEIAKSKLVVDGEEDEEESEKIKKDKAELMRMWALAGQYAGILTRSQVKRPSMTFAYAVSLMGVKDQMLHEDSCKPLFEQFAKTETAPADRDGKRIALNLLANTTLKGIRETVKDAYNGMQFLQGLAQKVGTLGLPVVWTLPDGFEVQQDYRKMKLKRIKTTVSGSIRIRKDKTALVQQDLHALAGLDLCVMTGLLHQSGTKKDTRALVKKAKDFINESGMLQMYRSEVAALLEEYGVDYDLKKFCLVRYAKLGLQPVPEIAAAVEACVDFVITRSMSAHHMREEEHEEVDEETGEVTKRHAWSSVVEATSEPDVAAQVRGIGPNVIHSIDACHMRMTIVAARAAGIENFAMVHDSYGTHCTDMEVLSQLTREQFVECHKNPLFDVFANDLVSAAYIDEAEVQVLREKFLKYGDLDINEVLDAEYMFS